MESKSYRFYFLLSIFSLAVLIGVFSFCGCEVDSGNSGIYITPDSGVLSKHGSVTLTAHNGYRYEWSLNGETWGVLNPRRGQQVVYTSLYAPTGGTPVVQIITVSSSLLDTSTSDDSSVTNGSSTTAETAEAYITHLPAEEEQSEVIE